MMRAQQEILFLSKLSRNSFYKFKIGIIKDTLYYIKFLEKKLKFT